MTTQINERKRTIESPHQGDINEHPGRQRSRAACAPCRQRKRKCDGNLPCGTCTRYEYACDFSSPGPSSASKRSSRAPVTTSTTAATGTTKDQADPATADNAHQFRTNEDDAPDDTPSRPDISRLQVHPRPGASFHHRSILDPTATRFVRANSAIAFPRILGMDMESETIPRLHSFAWHLGTRAELPEVVVDVTRLVTELDLRQLGKVFFATVRPEIGLLEESEFMADVGARFARVGSVGGEDFDAVALGVAALGSFFQPNPHPREEEFVVEALKSLTQRSMSQTPSQNNVAGWILRTVYLRLTARPHAAWMSSSITMHQLEASGLHKETKTIAVVYPAASREDHKLAKTRRRLFWIARALNIILSFEYGRSRVSFDVITTQNFGADTPGNHADQLVALAELLPNDLIDIDRDPDPTAALSKVLTSLADLPPTTAFLTCLKADLAFAIYRRLWLMSLTDAKARTETVLALGRACLPAAATLLETRTPWWNAVGAPFQFACVALAVGTPKSFALLPDIMDLLARLRAVYDTRMVREAYSQAAALVQMARKRRRRELEALEAAVPEVEVGAAGEGDPAGMGSAGMTDAPDCGGWGDWPFEWDAFLNPELVLSAEQQQGVGGLGFGAGFEGVFGV